MNKKIKRRLCLVCGVTSLICMSAQSVMAARPGFTFNVAAYSSTSTWTDNYYGNTNPKTVAGDDWTLDIGAIEFSKPVVGVGMAYALFRGNSRISGISWRTGTGAYYNSWDGATGYYYNLKGRLDTDQPGTCVSNGIYNADEI